MRDFPLQLRTAEQLPAALHLIPAYHLRNIAGNQIARIVAPVLHDPWNLMEHDEHG